jgi:hypothetical protein
MTASKANTTNEWRKTLSQPTIKIREIEFYNDGKLVNTRTNVEINNFHKIRGYSDPEKEAIHNFKTNN